MTGIRDSPMRSLLLFFLLGAPLTQAGAGPSAAALFETIDRRLAHMEDVALWKARNHVAVEEVEREKVVLARAKAAAAEQGLDPERIEGFFKAQIAAAKAIQYRYRAELLSHPTDRRSKDLEGEIRPALIRLGDQIVGGIAGYVHEHGGFERSQFAKFDRAITAKHLSERDKQRLFEALLEIRPR